MDCTFKYKLGTTVQIATSKEQGSVIAAATYAHSEDQYLVRYTAANGRAVEAWWGESALAAA